MPPPPAKVKSRYDVTGGMGERGCTTLDFSVHCLCRFLPLLSAKVNIRSQTCVCGVDADTARYNKWIYKTFRGSLRLTLFANTSKILKYIFSLCPPVSENWVGISACYLHLEFNRNDSKILLAKVTRASGLD